MQGLENDTNRGNNTYLSIINGKFALKVAEKTEGAIERTNKNGKIVFEKYFTGVTGFIKNVGISDGDFGKELHITVANGDNNFAIQIPASGGYSFGFLCRIPNINFTENATLKPFSIEQENGKIKNFLVVYQNDKKVISAFSKESPNGLPSLEEKTIKGNKIWDDTLRIEFFEEMIHGSGGVSELLAQANTHEDPKPLAQDDFLNEVNEPPTAEQTAYEKAMSEAEKGGEALKAEKKAKAKTK